MVVLVTGAYGQLGQSIQFIAKKHPAIQFIYTDYQELDITSIENVKSVFSKYQPTYCINTAAYTAVDKAETETEKAYQINVLGAKNLAKVSKEHNTILLHISTDFIFDGTSNLPYNEEAVPNPKSVYGQTKFDGELAIRNNWNKHFIVRTSWVYSQFGTNFLKTMLRLASERDTLSVVSDQIGTPTNAVDLAEVLLKVIQYCQTEPVEGFGTYNFSNEGSCSWYEFAQEIFKQKEITIDLKPIPTLAYPTPAKRPAYSVLDKSKIKNTFHLEIEHWRTALTKAIENV